MIIFESYSFWIWQLIIANFLRLNHSFSVGDVLFRYQIQTFSGYNSSCFECAFHVRLLALFSFQFPSQGNGIKSRE